jgi:hypothetical protein
MIRLARCGKLLCENVWPRSAFWLAFHEFVKPDALDREINRRYSITQPEEAEWLRIAEKV